MGSRRITTRSASWNGRMGNGLSNGNGRPAGCSYISNVRPDIRSTFCSVMAQLTEETQPSFEMTLKSRAVSENCNVKFSCVVTGHPTPQVTWYKDDVQMDRYCGLPKYEIFRNGQSHTLHIYNCTVEDAAIYQASAINTKGIVSCSGVLEVGEMNEFKIHQRYFTKLKQKAQQRCKEPEGKENNELLRTISPDRTQRKRRSTMEGFLSTPGSQEEAHEERLQTPAVKSEGEVRLQPSDEGKDEQKPVVNGQDVNESGNKGGSFIHDTAQKMFSSLQPKIPFVKKKIKISNKAKVSKPEPANEKTTEEKQTKDERTKDAVALSYKNRFKTTEAPDVKMEEEQLPVPRTLDTHSMDVRTQQKTVASDNAVKTPAERLSKDESARAVSPKTAAVSKPQSVSGAREEPAKRPEPKVGLKGSGEPSTKKQHSASNLNVPTSRPPRHTLSKQHSVREDVISKDVSADMDVDVKTETSTAGSLYSRNHRSADRPRDSEAVLSKQTGGQLSEKETGPGVKRAASETWPVAPREITQTQTRTNDAPVDLEFPSSTSQSDTLPTKKAETETCKDNTQTRPSHRGVSPAIIATKEDKILLTNTQKSEPEGLDANLDLDVSPPAEQSLSNAVEGSAQGTKMQVDEKEENTKPPQLSAVAKTEAPNEEVEMETETAVKEVDDELKTAVGKNTDKDTEASCNEKNIELSKKAEDGAFKTQILEENVSDKTSTSSTEIIGDFIEIPKPVSKVISVAELLRSQIKALELTLANSAHTPSVQTHFVEDLKTAVSETCQGSRTDDRKKDVDLETSAPERKRSTVNDEPPPTNIKATLMEVYHLINKDPVLSQTLLHVPDLQTPVVKETTEAQCPDTGQDSGTLHPVPSENPPAVVMNGIQNGQSEFPPVCENILVKEMVPVSDLPEIGPKSGDLIKVSVEELDVTVPKRPQHEPSHEPLPEPPNESSHELSQEPLPEPLPEPSRQPSQKEDKIQTFTPEIKFNDQTNSDVDLQKMEEPSRKTVPLQVEQRLSPLSIPSSDLQQNHSQEQSKSDLVSPTPEASPLLKKRNCVSPIPSATPQELASGARRKILTSKTKSEDVTEAVSPVENQDQKKEGPVQTSRLSVSPNVTPSTSPSLARRSSLLQPPAGRSSPVEKRSPLLSRRKAMLETPNQESTEKTQNLQTEDKPPEKTKNDPYKAPQVIRKIRAESFADASGHLKLWCQFFNVLSDSVIKWYKNEEEITHVKRAAGDETPVNLAIVQASCRDTGVYGCGITNEYGTDSTDTLLSLEILAGMSLREDIGVGEEIEMMPLMFSKGVADSGVWGSKFFGRIMIQESHIGDGCSHKVWRAKVIYGLEPVFESGNTCIIKVRSPITYGGKGEGGLVERNLEIIKQDCRIQNLAREYCKIFSAEARAIENFGPTLDVLPVYLIYRPANVVPYATVEADLAGDYQRYCDLGQTGRTPARTGSVVEQKCCTLQHWIYQWTSGNLLLTRLEGVDTKITNVGMSAKSTGHHCLSADGNPKVFEHFVSQHQCNYFCGLLGLRSLKVMDSLSMPTKQKGSKSPLLQRKMAGGSSSPQMGRKAAGSPRVPRKSDQEGSKTPTKEKASDAAKAVKAEQT